MALLYLTTNPQWRSRSRGGGTGETSHERRCRAWPDGTRFSLPYPRYTITCYDANGQIIAGMNLLVDITDRKKAQFEAISGTKRQLQLITENMDVGVTLDNLLPLTCRC